MIPPNFESWSHANLVEFARQAYAELARLKALQPVPSLPMAPPWLLAQISARASANRLANQERDSGAGP